MKCKYEEPYYECEEETSQNSDYCILHRDFPISSINNRFSPQFYNFMRLLEEKNSKIMDKIKKKDFNFRGSKLLELDLPKVKIEKDLVLWQAKIEGNLNFRESQINGNVECGGAEIKGYVDFSDTKIHGNIRFRGVKIDHNALFRRTTIKGNVEFDQAEIGDVLVFTEAKIEGNIQFSYTHIGGYTDFRNTTIGGCMYFRDADIGINSLGETSFDNITVFGNVYFQGALFHRKAFFSKIKFLEDANFEDTQFTEDVDFKKATFQGNVYFSKVKNEIIFKKFVSFKEASFSGKVLFKGLNNFKGSFEGARLKNVVFKYCNLTNVRFKEVILDNCELSTSKLPDKIVEHEEYDNKRSKTQEYLNFLNSHSQTIVQDAEAVSDTYRRIRQCLQNQGAYTEAGEFYIKEMKMKKEVYKVNNKSMWIFYVILDIFSGYGERPGRLAFFLVVVTVSFSIIKGWPCFNGNPNLSAIILLIIQTAIIPFFMALFVYAFARKMSR